MKHLIKPPTHVLRNKCIEAIVDKLLPGRFLEIGSGVGEETKIFLRRAFYGVCCEVCEESRTALAGNLSEYKDKIKIVGDCDSLAPGTFDYLIIFDVLEHIEADADTLKYWTSFLKAGGILLIAVPAHMNALGKSDELMGHFRRYEKNGLFEIMTKSGYQSIKILSYGFPLINFTLKAINIIYKLAPKTINEYKDIPSERKTMLSGAKSPDIISRFSFLFNDFMLFPFILMQKMFLGLDWGVAYVAYGKKTENDRRLSHTKQ
ncbi:MAG: methyltransferase domain-containing protein [Candidatus Margulisiibacteriota bacterium]